MIITHQHADHCDTDLLCEILAANPRAAVLAEPEAAAQIVGQADGPAAGPGQAPARGKEVVPLPAGSSYQVGQVKVSAIGGLHAVIHPDIPRVGNSGLVIEAPDEKRLGVTGDSLVPEPEFQDIDVLAFAVVAPWSKMSETIDFLRNTRPAYRATRPRGHCQSKWAPDLPHSGHESRAGGHSGTRLAGGRNRHNLSNSIYLSDGQPPLPIALPAEPARAGRLDSCRWQDVRKRHPLPLGRTH